MSAPTCRACHGRGHRVHGNAICSGPCKDCGGTGVIAESPADVLRRAASLMRERAKAATPGPWRDSSTGAGAKYGALVADAPHPDRTPAEGGGWGWDDAYGGCLIGESLMPSDRAHIASWHPAVALAVADWLDETADVGDMNGFVESEQALAVARAYLGESA